MNETHRKRCAMIDRNKTSRAMATLLIPLMVLALVLSAGLHLRLCFCNDGRMDISLDACRDAAPLQRQSKAFSACSQTQYGECLEFSAFCNTSREFVRPVVKTGTFQKTVIKNPLNTAGFPAFVFSNSFADKAPYSLHPNSPASASLHLVCRHTVLLLI